MREKVLDKSRIEHMLNACNILLQKKEQTNLSDAVSDPVTFYGLVKLVEIIGEATYKLTKEFREAHPVLPWEDIENMRHVLVHGYYQIKPDQLIDTIENDIPAMIPILDSLLSELSDQ